VVPKPTSDTVPLLPTGHARQEVEWIAEHGDGWFFYHLPMDTLESYLADWREAAGDKPYAMAVQTELADDRTAGPEPIHLGYRAGSEWFGSTFAIWTRWASTIIPSRRAVTTRGEPYAIRRRGHRVGAV